MKKIILFLLPFLALMAKAQVSPVYYQSNYIRVVQPDQDDSSDLYPYTHNDIVSYNNTKAKFDTLLNPFTGGFNNATFFNIDFNGDGIQDLYVFDRELGENQFLLFQGLSNKSTSYRYTPQYHYQFPQDVSKWVELADYNKDGRADIFSASANPRCNTCIKVYKNTSYRDVNTGNYINQFTVAADPIYYYDSLGNRNEIDVSTASNPQFVDIDKDGYLDILGFDLNLIAPRFYRNQGKGIDSLSFWYTKECWGYFNELTQHLYTPWNCERNSANQRVWTGTYDPDPMYRGASAHFFNSMRAFDVDCDGDIDLLLGDGLNDSLAFLENGNINGNHSYHKDTIINISFYHNNNEFPLPGPPSVIATMPTASWLDVNHDTLNDLIVAAGQPTFRDSFVVDRIHNIWYYNNEGSKASSPGGASNIFNLSTKDFLQNTMVDWGINSAPCFIDVDNDGRKDLIVAVKDGGAKNGFSHLVLYLNKAGKTPASKPYLLYKTDDYLGFSKLSTNISWPIPAAYLNGKDGKTDLLIGNTTGQVMYFKNDGSVGGNPANFHLSTSTLEYISRPSGKLVPINIGSSNSAPTAADLNGDGKMDLLIGSNYGTISYYRCLGYLPGSDNVPYFELVTDTLGGLYTAPGSDFQTVPCVADIDKDGKPDLLVGDEYGRLWYYHDFDTLKTLVPTNQILVYDNGADKVDSNRIFSHYIVPAVADLDGDGYPDIMLGCVRGGLIFLGSANNGFENLRNSTGVEPVIYNPMGMSLFPNPAKDMFTLEYNNTDKQINAQLVVTDMLGRQILSHNFIMQNGKGGEQLSTSGLAAGIYIVNVESADQLLFSNKLVVEK